MRRKISCLECRNARMKCEGGNPCKRCKKYDLTCVFTQKKRGRKPESRVAVRRVKKAKPSEQSPKGMKEHLRDEKGIVGEFVEPFRESRGTLLASTLYEMTRWILNWYQCNPMSSEEIDIMAQLIPEDKVGVVFDCIQPYSKRDVYYSKRLRTLLDETNDELEMNKDLHNDIRDLAKKNNNRLPKEEVLPGPYVFRLKNSVGGWYEGRNVHVRGGVSVEGISETTRAIAIWVDKLKGPYFKATVHDSWKDSIKAYLVDSFGYKRVRDLDDWEAHVDEFLRTVSAKRPLPKYYTVLDLLEKSTSGYGVILNHTPYAWHTEETPPTIISMNGMKSMLKVLQQLIMGSVQEYMELPDIKVIRGKGSAYMICKGVHLYMPKSGTFFPIHHCKLCCITYDSIDVH